MCIFSLCYIILCRWYPLSRVQLLMMVVLYLSECSFLAFVSVFGSMVNLYVLFFFFWLFILFSFILISLKFDFMSLHQHHFYLFFINIVYFTPYSIFLSQSLLTAFFFLLCHFIHFSFPSTKCFFPPFFQSNYIIITMYEG